MRIIVSGVIAPAVPVLLFGLFLRSGGFSVDAGFLGVVSIAAYAATVLFVLPTLVVSWTKFSTEPLRILFVAIAAGGLASVAVVLFPIVREGWSGVGEMWVAILFAALPVLSIGACLGLIGGGAFLIMATGAIRTLRTTG